MMPRSGAGRFFVHRFDAIFAVKQGQNAARCMAWRLLNFLRENTDNKTAQGGT
jgi:hypothetical protein